MQMAEILHNVWVVDDDPIARLLIRKRLEKDSFCDKIAEFENGLEALQRFQNKDRSKPDLILLDLNMPVMDGWALLDSLKESQFNKNLQLPPIAILTSSIDKEDRDQAESYANIISFLKKPLDLPQLIEDLKRLRL
jgi:CheY-like chemotaxis protein